MMNKAVTIAIAFLFLVSCAQIKTLNPPQQSDWQRTLYHARLNVDSGNYFAADKLLDEFVRTHPDTREAREIAFWKAAYLLDPANDHGSLTGGISGLDGYLSANPDGWYRIEAALLKRTALVAEGIANGTKASTGTDSSTTPVVKDTVVVVSKSREEQIAALRDQLAQSKAELAKVSAELERIKKRLANPSN
jgi:TolA-binding protein